MPVDIKTLVAEIEAEVADAKTAIAALQAEVVANAVGNVPDADAATIRTALSDLKSAYSPPTPAPPPAPQPAPAPPTN